MKSPSRNENMVNAPTKSNQVKKRCALTNGAISLDGISEIDFVPTQGPHSLIWVKEKQAKIADIEKFGINARDQSGKKSGGQKT